MNSQHRHDMSDAVWHFQNPICLGKLGSGGCQRRQSFVDPCDFLDFAHWNTVAQFATDLWEVGTVQQLFRCCTGKGIWKQLRGHPLTYSKPKQLQP